MNTAHITATTAAIEAAQAFDQAIECAIADATKDIVKTEQPFEWLRAVNKTLQPLAEVCPYATSPAVTQVYFQIRECWFTILHTVSPRRYRGDRIRALRDGLVEECLYPDLQLAHYQSIVANRPQHDICIMSNMMGLKAEGLVDATRFWLRVSLWSALSKLDITARRELLEWSRGTEDAHTHIDKTRAAVMALDDLTLDDASPMATNTCELILNIFNHAGNRDTTVDSAFIDALYFLYARVPSLFTDNQ